MVNQMNQDTLYEADIKWSYATMLTYTCPPGKSFVDAATENTFATMEKTCQWNK